jgi:hypothetical protein
MNTSESFSALRRANPRAKAGFERSVDAVSGAVRVQIATSAGDVATDFGEWPRRRLLRISAASASLAVVLAVAAFLAVGSLSGGPGVESAAAAIKKAASVTAASAEHSGTAVVRITHDDEIWAGTTVRWNARDVAVYRDAPQRAGKVGDALLVVDGILYGVDPGVVGGWIELGDPSAIDPDSGTTPYEYLAAVRENVGGVTLRRFTESMSGLTARGLADGSTVYGGTVAAGLIARETGFKEGQAIRVLPFGYVAHDEAADPASPLHVAVTVGPDRIVREIVVTWGSTPSAWTYTVTYSGLGATPAPVAPATARSIEDLRRTSLSDD